MPPWATALSRRPYAFAAIVLLCILAANALLTFTVINGQADEIRLLEEKAFSSRRGEPGGAAGKTIMDIETFEKRLPDDRGLIKVVDGVFSVARKNGLDIPAGDYSPSTVTRTGISRYTISFPVEGRYREIKKFIYDLETMPQAVVIEEIAFSRSRVKRGTIGLTIRLSAYFR